MAQPTSEGVLAQAVVEIVERLHQGNSTKMKEVEKVFTDLRESLRAFATP